MLFRSAAADQVAFQDDMTKRFQKLSRDLENLAERTDNSIQEMTEKTKLKFSELLQRADKTDIELSHILQQLSIIAKAKTNENSANNSLRPITTSTQEAPLLDEGIQR